MTRDRTLAGIASVMVVVAALASCKPSAEDVANGDDPIKALGVSVRSTRYEGPFWAEQRRLKSDVWQQAVAYCTPARAPEHPNCEPVLANLRAEQGNARADSVLRSIGAGARKPPTRDSGPERSRP